MVDTFLVVFGDVDYLPDYLDVLVGGLGDHGHLAQFAVHRPHLEVLLVRYQLLGHLGLLRLAVKITHFIIIYKLLGEDDKG